MVYREGFMNVAITLIKGFFTASYKDWEGRCRYCFLDPESISAYVHRILSPSGPAGSFHWDYWESDDVCRPMSYPSDHTDTVFETASHGVYEHPMLLEIIVIAHLKRVQGASTRDLPSQEPIQALVRALISVCIYSCYTT